MTKRTFLKYTLLTPFILNLTSYAKQLNLWKAGKYGFFEFEKIHKNIFVMHGANTMPDEDNMSFINNIGLIVGKKGLILIDSGRSYLIAQKIMEQVKNISSKPIVAIINTHNHDDHWFGNGAIKEQYPNVQIYAHEKMEQVAKELYFDYLPSRKPSLQRAKVLAYPNKFLRHKQSITIAGEELYIQHPEAAHTLSDITITHIKSNIIFMGDTLLESTLANFGLHSSIQGNIRFLEKIEKQHEYTSYVVGHGKIGTKQQTLIPYLQFLQIIEEEVTKAYKNDIDVFELATCKNRIIQRIEWEGENWNFPLYFLDRYMEHIYGELEA